MADIVKRDPFRLIDRDLGGLRGAFDRLFDDSFFRSSLLEEGSLEVDVYRKNGNVMVEASLPGFARDEIDVQLHEGVLAIKGEHREEKEEKEKDCYRRERRYGAVSRRIALPGIVSEAPVQAELKNGVLKVEIAVPERAQPKSVEIKET